MKLNPFMGFSLFGIHSTQFNVQRILDGGRYYDDLSPRFNNTTVSVDGHIGEYDFGTNIEAQPFLLKCFCENITEIQYRQLRRWLAPGKRGRLIFDESPYKAYTVGLESPVSFPFIAVNDGKGGYTYTGKFDVNLVAYDPYGYSIFDSLSDGEIEYNKGYFYDSGLLYVEWLPNTIFHNIQNNKNIILYNGGTVACNVNVRINGTWDQLTIKNFTTNQQFTLKKNTRTELFEVDANYGQCRLNGLLASDYHSGTYLQLAGTDSIEHHAGASFTNGDNIVSFPIDNILQGDVVGRHIFIQNDRYKITDQINDRQIKLDSKFRGDTGLYDAVIVDANEILITGVNLDISKIEFLYRYAYI